MKDNRVCLWYVFGMCILLVCVAGCGMYKVTSTWRDRDVTINGQDDGNEWANALYPLEDEKVTFGLLNDGSSLYVRLATRDRARQRQILSHGLTVWVNTKGNKDKVLGIHYPIGMMVKAAAFRSDRNTDNARPSQEEIKKLFDESLMNIEIIGIDEKNSRNTMLINEAGNYGINVKMNSDKGILVYELQINFIKYGEVSQRISSAMPEIVGLGFESGNQNMEMRSRPRGGYDSGNGDFGGRGGGMGGGSRRGGGGRGGNGQMEMRQAFQQPMELWLKTQVTKKP